jgi:hypothetical protein
MFLPACNRAVGIVVVILLFSGAVTFEFYVLLGKSNWVLPPLPLKYMYVICLHAFPVAGCL